MTVGITRMPKKLRLICLLSLIVIIASSQSLPSFPQAIAQSEDGITVETDHGLYVYTTDNIPVIVFGRVSADLIEPDQQVRLQVFNPNGGAYPVHSADLREDRWYSSEIEIAGELGIEGEYRVIASYQGRTAETTFRVADIILESQCARPCNYDLVAGDNTYTIRYLGDRIRNMTINEGAKSLVIVPNPGSEGLTIVVPRSVVDSKDGNIDKNYTILIDGEAAVFSKIITHKPNEFTEINAEGYRQILKEGQNPEDVRILQIVYPRGLHQIDIVGTQIVPEFGLSSIMLASALGASFVVMRYAASLQRKR
jgi:hypothetical protein